MPPYAASISALDPRLSKHRKMTLWLEGIAGESKFEANCCDIYDVGWGLKQEGTFHMGGGGGGGIAAVRDFEVFKEVDKSSADLIGRCFSGVHIPSATFKVYKAGGGNLVYLEYHFWSVIVSDYELMNDDPTSKLRERLKLNFASCRVTYTMQADHGGGGEQSDVTFDVTTNSLL